MIRLPAWTRHQAAIINHVKSSRKTRGMEADTELVMQRFSVASSWDRDFIEKFAPRVGHRSAETFFVRLLQYVATHDGMTGECRVPRDDFGALVLSRVGDTVSRRDGQKAYDALLFSGIAVSIGATVTSVDTDVNTGDALPSRSDPTRSDPPRSEPSRAGGSSPPASDGDGAAGPKPLTPSDRAVFELLFSRTQRGLAPGGSVKSETAELARRLRATLVTPTPDLDGVRAFVDAFQNDSPTIIAEVAQVRRNAAMTRNERERPK